MDWDDLRIFLQLARTGRMAGAGRALGLDDTTVGRRVARLERQVGAALVARAGRRTVITEQGQKLAQAAEEMESIVLRKIVGLGEAGMQVAGRVRIGAPEGLGVGYLASRLAALSAENPKLETELVALPRAYSLASREVDIAITLDRPIAGQLSVKKLTDYTLELYGTQAYFDRRGRPGTAAELQGHVFAGYIPELLFTRALDFSTLEAGVEVTPVIRSTSVIAQVNAVLSGAALGVLPAFLAAAHPELQVLLKGAFRLTRSYWVSVHDDLKHLNRVRAVLEAITTTIRADRAVFMGR
ncbi:LysR family transcriptional regulator [Xanthobacter autotrophicus]|uniref:LysR family transcriptional regulator n=1 Tax=Xanthobacter TaxID=279 RepID=UPI0024AAA6C2|nr:LysR family transcriptional regulator [Xanthobacter autotrophicus]MDI4664032.1 LysR family transcriptional regulator [Xanthobacter autotrophicus]